MTVSEENNMSPFTLSIFILSHQTRENTGIFNGLFFLSYERKILNKEGFSILLS